jgi:FAD binding domain
MTALSRTCRTTSYVENTSFGGGRAILVGDAAHGFCPNIGMGLTSAIADAVVLGDAIEAAGGHVARLPSTWTSLRMPEMRYMVKLGRGSEYLSYPGRGMSLLQALPGFIPHWLAHSSTWSCWTRLPGVPTGCSQLHNAQLPGCRASRSCVLSHGETVAVTRHVCPVIQDCCCNAP